VDLSAEAISGNILDFYANQATDRLMAPADQELIKTKSYAILSSKFPGNGDPSFGKGKIIEVVIKALDEAFSGDLIPLDVLLAAHLSLNKRGELIFESQLKDEYFLEQRTDIAFKYGYFEDANWTIVGQITSLKPPINPILSESLKELKTELDKVFADKENLDVNLFAKSMVREIDLFSKRLGLLPLVGQRHIAFTPIAIYREPQINKYFAVK
jgi:hypothetical protein